MKKPSKRLTFLPALLVLLFFFLPAFGLLMRTPWREFFQILGRYGAFEAMGVSALVGTIVLLLCCLFGIPAAYHLAEANGSGTRVLRAAVLLPLVMPPVVGGIGLLSVFGRRGFLGRYLADWFGVSLPFTLAGAVLAAFFVSAPLFILAMEAGFRARNRRLEKIAAVCGASPMRVFVSVTFPMVRPAFLSGAALALGRALGEFGATITFAGNLPGRTRTLPLAAYQALQTSPEAAFAISAVLILAGLALLPVAIRGRRRVLH
ncbi:MAG: molybdate ABC transporter permease subunit [Candidatus Hydrogenedentota bacterium]|nr:MAG: molybdate ABC transporter permease subunit [Candidatus Hydrogenedentota bacterium]